MGYLGILVGLFHKILFGGSVSRQKSSVKVSSKTALALVNQDTLLAALEKLVPGMFFFFFFRHL